MLSLIGQHVVMENRETVDLNLTGVTDAAKYIEHENVWESGSKEPQYAHEFKEPHTCDYAQYCKYRKGDVLKRQSECLDIHAKDDCVLEYKCVHELFQDGEPFTWAHVRDMGINQKKTVFRVPPNGRVAVPQHAVWAPFYLFRRWRRVTFVKAASMHECAVMFWEVNSAGTLQQPITVYIDLRHIPQLAADQVPAPYFVGMAATADPAHLELAVVQIGSFTLRYLNDSNTKSYGDFRFTRLHRCDDPTPEHRLIRNALPLPPLPPNPDEWISIGSSDDDAPPPPMPALPSVAAAKPVLKRRRAGAAPPKYRGEAASDVISISSSDDVISISSSDEAAAAVAAPPPPVAAATMKRQRASAAAEIKRAVAAPPPPVAAATEKRQRASAAAEIKRAVAAIDAAVPPGHRYFETVEAYDEAVRKDPTFDFTPFGPPWTI
jgi:hypothetical protein